MAVKREEGYQQNSFWDSRRPLGEFLTIRYLFLFIIFFSLNFKENQTIKVYQIMADEGGRILVLGSQQTKKTIFGHVRYLFLFIFFQTLVLTKILPIRSIGSVWRRIRYIWEGMNLGKDSVMPQFEVEDAEGSKTQDLRFFQPIDRKSKVVQYIRKSTPKLIRRGDWGFAPFWPQKSVVPPLSTLQIEPISWN